MRVCVSTWTSDEKARERGEERLVGEVRGHVEGREGVVAVVEGGRGVDEVVARLRDAKVDARAGKRGVGGWNGLDVVVWVGEGKFVGRVKVVGKVDGDEVEIAGRVWKRRNLRATKYNDGTEIKQALTVDEFVALSKLKKPAYYIIDEKSGTVYSGTVYNKYVDVSEKGVSPEGWGLPTDTDVKELVRHYDTLAAVGGLSYGSPYWGPAVAALTAANGEFKAEMTGYITVSEDGTNKAGLVGNGDVARLWNCGQSNVWWGGDGGSGCLEIHRDKIQMRNEWSGSHLHDGNAIRLLKKRP